MRIVFSGGGTGGHVYPALSVHEALQRRAAEKGIPLEVAYLGHPQGVEASLVARAGVPFHPVESGQIRGQGIGRGVRSGLKVLQGYGQALAALGKLRPHVVFVTGGWVVGPVVLAAWTRRIPVVMYLPDVTPGLAVRRLQRFARRIAVTVPEAASYFPGKAVVTGYPVRDGIVRARRDRARGRWQIGEEERVLLVFGGSRGARSLNRALTAHVTEVLSVAHVIHVTGPLDYTWVREVQNRLPPRLQRRYHVHEYLHEEMADALAAADLVVSRAGASVLGEFPARGLPAILVPYPYAGRHQEANARYLADRGAAIVIPDEDVQRVLGSMVRSLLLNGGQLSTMAGASRRLYRENAALRLADLLLSEGEAHRG